MASERSFFPVLTMEDAMAIDMAALALATAASDAAIFPGADAAAAPVITQPVATVGEFVPVPSIPIAPTASEAVRSAGVRVAASASRNRPADPEDDVPMYEAGTSLFPVPRLAFNRGWLTTAIAFSKDRKYDGISVVPQKQDQKTRCRPSSIM